MLEIVKSTVRVFAEKLREITKDGKTSSIDIVGEISELNASILLSCAFGYDFSGEIVDFHIDGRVEKKTTVFLLKNTMLGMV